MAFVHEITGVLGKRSRCCEKDDDFVIYKVPRPDCDETALMKFDEYLLWIRETYVFNDAITTTSPMESAIWHEITKRFFQAPVVFQSHMLDYALRKYDTRWARGYNLPRMAREFAHVVWSKHFMHVKPSFRCMELYANRLVSEMNFALADEFFAWMEQCKSSYKYRVRLHTHMILKPARTVSREKVDAIVRWYETCAHRKRIRIDARFYFHEVQGPAASWKVSETYALGCVRLGMRPIEMVYHARGGRTRSFFYDAEDQATAEGMTREMAEARTEATIQNAEALRTLPLAEDIWTLALKMDDTMRAVTSYVDDDDEDDTFVMK